MARSAREPNEQLQALIDEAGFSHKGLARRVNDLGRARGIVGLAYDHSSVIRWLKGEHPREPAPTLIAEVFSMSLGRKIKCPDLGLPSAKTLPDLGLRFARSLSDTIDIVTALWRSDLERRQFIINSISRLELMLPQPSDGSPHRVAKSSYRPSQEGKLAAQMSRPYARLPRPFSGSITYLAAVEHAQLLCVTCTTRWRHCCAKAGIQSLSVGSCSQQQPS